MNKVECHVASCTHHNNNLCQLDKIQVDGPAAKEKGQTCCLSFDEKIGSAQNAVGSSSSREASPETGIHCKAGNCSYNSNSKCSANCITVGSSCATVSSKSGTECSSFVER